jgi:Zn-dependent protease
MTKREKTLFILSVIASVAIWGGLYSWKAGLVIVFLVLVHEYGHYWQMGREGIGKRMMLFLPPFGVVAMAKEQWPSRPAETRIALAGPV